MSARGGARSVSAAAVSLAFSLVASSSTAVMGSKEAAGVAAADAAAAAGSHDIATAAKRG